MPLEEAQARGPVVEPVIRYTRRPKWGNHMAIPGQGRLAIGGAVAAIMVGLLAPGAAAASEQAEADAGPGCRFLDVRVPASVLE
jgi:hypothetical protein